MADPALTTYSVTYPEAAAFVKTPDKMFSVSIDPAFFLEFTGQLEPGTKGARETALSVPAVSRSRNIIAGGIGQLPLAQYTARGVRARSDRAQLVTQPEAGVAPMLTMTETAADLLLDGYSTWRIVGRDANQRPSLVARVDQADQSPDVETFRPGYGPPRVRYKGGYLTDGVDAIIFRSPNPALLFAAQRAIANLLTLDKTSVRNAQGNPPIDWFEPTDGFSMDAEEITEFLAAWKSARQAGATGYVPAGLAYQTSGFDPDKAGMGGAKDYAILEIARHAGLDPEYLGVSTTSRTYANMYDRRKFLVDFTLNPYMLAIEQRLSLNDVSAAGNYAKFNVDAFLRGSTTERYAAHEKAIAIGLYDVKTAKTMEDIA